MDLGPIGGGERTLVKQGNDFSYKDLKVAEVTEGRMIGGGETSTCFCLLLLLLSFKALVLCF